LYQNQSIKQYLVDKLKEKAPVVCIAHPSVREGHAASVLQNLSGYDCLELKEVMTEGTHLTLNLWQKADTIRLIRQNGVVKAEAYHTRFVTYTFTPADAYIRAEIITPEADFYLNPVLRYDGQYPPENYKVATTDVWLTFLWRYAIVVISFLSVCLLYKKEIHAVLHGRFRAFPQTALEGV
jgi:hypothetical protein